MSDSRCNTVLVLTGVVLTRRPIVSYADLNVTSRSQVEEDSFQYVCVECRMQQT